MWTVIITALVAVITLSHASVVSYVIFSDRGQVQQLMTTRTNGEMAVSCEQVDWR